MSTFLLYSFCCCQAWISQLKSCGGPTTIHTSQSTLHTLYSTIHTLNFTLYTHALHLTLHNPNSTLHTSYSTLHNPLSTLHTPYSTIHTLHFTLYSPHSTLDTPQPKLHTPHFTLHVSLLFHSRFTQVEFQLQKFKKLIFKSVKSNFVILYIKYIILVRDRSCRYWALWDIKCDEVYKIHTLNIV